ncbi:MAG: hypothetical protein ACO2O6_03630 [Candidatus Hydrothermia bacterium]|jgi:hypothetical protein
MNAVVLVVDKYSLDIHIHTLTAGVKYPVDYNNGKIYYKKEFFSILADLANIDKNTLVFFYKRRIDEPPDERGFIGIWKAREIENQIVIYEDLKEDIHWNNKYILSRCKKCGNTNEVVDDDKIKCSKCKIELGGHILPLRFPIEEYHIFKNYLDDNTAYIDITDSGRLSTLIFRKIYGAGRERSVNPILPEEAEKLKRLLQRVENEGRNQKILIENDKIKPFNPNLRKIKPIYEYLDFSKKYNLKIGRKLKEDQPLYYSNGKVLYETILEFWMVKKLKQNPKELMHLFQIPENEYIEWFANQVLFGIGGEKSDIIILTKNENHIRCRAIVIELKRDIVDKKACEQIKKYVYWIAQLVSSQVITTNPFTITPIIIGYEKSEDIGANQTYNFKIPYSQPLNVKVEPIRIYTYKVKNNEIHLLKML